MDGKEYCSLPQRAVLQKSPKGATLYCRTAVRDSNAPWRRTIKRGVNRDGAGILELCLGRLTASEIISEFNRRQPDNALSPADGLGFLEAAEKAGMITFSEKPAPDPSARICGNFEVHYPEHTTIELTNCCNLTCSHCYRAGSTEKERYIDRALLMRYLEAFKAHGGTITELTGGEATLHPDFFSIAAWCHSNMNTLGVLTNGYGIGPKEAQALAEFRDNTVVAISLDSHRPDFHNRFRGRSDAFERTSEAIRLLAGKGVFVRVGMSVSLENFFDIEDTIKLAKELGATKFTYSMVYDVGRAGESTLSRVKALPDSARYLEYYDRMAVDHAAFLVTLSEGQRKSLRKGNCGLVHRSVALSPSGILRPCVMFEGSLSLGDISSQSFEEIFSSGIGNRFAAVSGPKKEHCGDCRDLPYCSNCVLRGLKTSLEKGGCAWLERSGASGLAGNMNLRRKDCILAAEPEM